MLVFQLMAKNDYCFLNYIVRALKLVKSVTEPIILFLHCLLIYGCNQPAAY